jgi:hypothetical protein
VLFGDAGNDRLEGGNGNDTLSGGAEADVLLGGPGNDTLTGGTGMDSYIWSPGDGADQITESYSPGHGINELLFTDTVSPSMINKVAVGNNLKLEVLDSNSTVIGSVTFVNWYLSSNLDWMIKFPDGTIWFKSLMGTSAGDVLKGGVAADSLNGEGGNDTVYGGSNDDSLKGGAGNDIIYGEDGSDLIEGGSGNDTLYGGAGANRYVYHLGDGSDQIYSNSTQPTVKDVLDLTSISRSNCGIQVLSQTGGLRIALTFLSTQETLTIYNAEKLIIEFADAIVELDAQGNDTRANNTGILAGWSDSDGDGYPDDVEQALQTHASGSANPSNPAVIPVADAIADASVVVASGNRYPTIQAALAAAEASRNGKPYVVIKVEPGVYAEDLLIQQSGVMLKGGGSAGRTIIKKGSAGKHSISGSRLVFDQLCLGDVTEAQSMTLQSGTGIDSLRFTSCLFRMSPLGVVQGLDGGSASASQGDAAFVHCTWIGAQDIAIASGAKITLVNSLVDAPSDSAWAQSSKVVKFSSIVAPFSSNANSSTPSVRGDGLLKVLYPGKVSIALDSVATADRIQGSKDLDGETRDITPDIGCDEYLDSDDSGMGDALADCWETRHFGSLTSHASTGDPDSDGQSNLEEYLAETDPLNSANGNPSVTSPNLAVASSYQSSNLFGANPLPSSGSADWLLDNASKVQLVGRQGALEFDVYLQEGKIAALSLDASFKHLTTGATIPGAARIYLDGELVRYVVGPLTNVFLPLYFVAAGDHRIRVELLNSYRDYSPILNSIALKELASEYVSAGLMESIILSTNRITRLPAASLVSPVCVEGKSLHRSDVSIDLPAQAASVEIHSGPNQGWFANVPLEGPSAATSILISLENGSYEKAASTQWIPTILGSIPALKIRKGDSLRLQADGAAQNSLVSYKINGQTVGTALAGSALTCLFDVAGISTVTAEVNGVAIPNAVTTVTVASADFGPVFHTAAATSTSWQVDVASELPLEADESLGLVSRNGSTLKFTPPVVGSHLMATRLERDGAIIATGEVNVFSVTTTGFDGGGRLISVLPDGRSLIDMSYSVDGKLPANLLIKVEVWISGTTFVDGSRVAWLRPEDFDQFGVANLQVIATDGGHGICQRVNLYLESEE